MPTYEYRCQDCGKRVSIYQTYEEYGRVPVHCPKCGGGRLARLLSRVRFARSEESRLDSIADPGDWGDVNEEDPRSLARMMRKMGSELGEDVPPEFDEVVGRLESGESPEDIEETMPDIGGSPGEDTAGDDFGE